MDGPAAPRPGGRSGRVRPNSVRRNADPLAGVGSNGAGSHDGAPTNTTPSMPSPPLTAAAVGDTGSGEVATGGWAQEWTTGEVATSTMEPPVTYDSAPPGGRPDPSGLGSRSGRTRNRPLSVSGRVPIIAPAIAPLIAPGTPFDPPAPAATPGPTPPPAPIEIRPADTELRLAVEPVRPAVPAAPADGASPVARRGDPVGLPSAEMLATLVEPEPLVEHVVEPEPEELPPTSAARPTRTLPVLFRRRPRARVRRVTRVVRHIDTWSVFKVALVFNVVLYVVCLTAGVLLWNVAYTTGTIDNIEKFFEQFGWSSFQFKGGVIYHNAWVAGLFATVGLTGLAVLLATLFNLITDLVGGVRVSVLEEEVVARAPAGETTIVRRRAPRDRALEPLERLEQVTAAATPTATRRGPSRFMRRPAAGHASSSTPDQPPTG